MRDAGTDRDVANRATVLRTMVTATGLPWIIPLMETALTFHHLVRDAQDDLTATLNRLGEATADDDYTYYVNIATAMGDLPQPIGPTISVARQRKPPYAPVGAPWSPHDNTTCRPDRPAAARWGMGILLR
ncbi:hypothetical protein ADK70_04460 [Streptomyces rimosus subsp. pseudoverticillatus]|uniref:hypothetical protein n=1 Tax=Streptomyces rimosus TaxID=1927 RepID=UPI0006B2A86C|nr:hypothetical protein [Streptomyces rimosus]KOT99264.1 hypothetical protein ADK70_04460 [Streptomyces rimosus subsp. pseudoverticillatus]